MRPRFPSSIGFALLVAGFSSLHALAEDRAAWLKSLRQPVTGMSCCDISDCNRTDAEWRQGQWWAMLNGKWVVVPRETLLDKTSIDGDAYICAGRTGTIYCFIPPTMSM